MRRLPIFLLAVVVGSVGSSGLWASAPGIAFDQTAPDPAPTRTLSVSAAKVAGQEVRAPEVGKDQADKRLRMRQVLLLWLLAAQPAR